MYSSWSASVSLAYSMQTWIVSFGIVDMCHMDKMMWFSGHYFLFDFLFWLSEKYDDQDKNNLLAFFDLFPCSTCRTKQFMSSSDWQQDVFLFLPVSVARLMAGLSPPGLVAPDWWNWTDMLPCLFIAKKFAFNLALPCIFLAVQPMPPTDVDSKESKDFRKAAALLRSLDIFGHACTNMLQRLKC